MSDPITTLTVTPSAGSKGATLTGSLAAGELVAVTLVGLGPRVAGGLVLSITGASGQLAACEVWAVSGANATGVLDLNTVEMLAAMTCQHGVSVPRHGREFSLSVWSLLSQALLVSNTVRVLPNPYSEGMSAPTPVAPWGTDLTAERADIAALEVAMLAHDHDGIDAASIDHLGLLNRGVLTHAALDAAIASASAALAALQDRAAALESWRTEAAALIAAQGDAGGVVANWIAAADATLAGLAAADSMLLARVQALEDAGAAVPVDLGWDVGGGTTLRTVAGDTPTYGDLLKAFRTLVADLKGRNVI